MFSKNSWDKARGDILDWSTFVPDIFAGIITGVFTGLVVGGILSWTQSKAIEKQRKWEMENAVSLLKNELEAIVFFNQNTLDVTKASSSAPQATKEVMEIITKHLLHTYEQYITNDFLNCLKKLKIEYAHFQRLSNELDQKMSDFIRVYNAERGAIPSNDDFYRTYFLGRLHDFTEEQIQPWMSPHSTNGKEEPYQRFYERNTQIIADYLISYEELLNILEQIRSTY